MNEPMSASHMTALILTRLGLNKEWNDRTMSPLFKKKEVEELKESRIFFYKRKEGEKHIPSVKFFTNVDVEQQLETIFQSKEFQYDISSPRYPADSSKDEFEENKISLKNSENRKITAFFNKTVRFCHFI